MKEDPFKILGISRDVTPEELEKAYEHLEFIYHPDQFLDKEEKLKAEEKLIQIDKAYREAKKILSKKYKRKLFEFKSSKESSPGKVQLQKAILTDKLRKKFWIFGSLVPVNNKNKFYSYQEEIYLWLKLKNLDREKFHIRVEWITPYSELFQYISHEIDQVCGSTIFYCWINTFSIVKNALFGTWLVKVYLNREEVVTIPFEFLNEN